MIQPPSFDAADSRHNLRRGVIWSIPVIIGVVSGVLGTASLALLLFGISVLSLPLIFVLGRNKAERIVAAYWIIFCLGSTMLTSFVVPGMFNLFYAAFLVAIVGKLVRRSLLVDSAALWILGLLTFVILASLVGYKGSMAGAALDRLLVVPLSALIVLQVTSASGRRLISLTAILSSFCISVWVIYSAVTSEFAYRSSIDMNQNVAAFYIGLGFVISLAWIVYKPTWARRLIFSLIMLLPLVVMAYSLILLASRGVMFAIGFVILAALIYGAFTDRTRLPIIAVLLLLTSSGLLLPGGQGILKRFEDPSTESGGGRVQIWGVVLRATTDGTASELLIGHGLESSAKVVRDRFTYLSSTHNSYLAMMHDHGIIGLGLFIAVHLLILARSFHMQASRGFEMVLLTIFLMGVSLFMQASNNYLYWAAIGFMLGASRIRTVGRTTEATLVA